MEGHGNSNSLKLYEYVDNSISFGKYNYRLKQIDIDGTFEYSDVVEVDLGNAPTEFSLSQNYPNPFNPTTTINYKIPLDEKRETKDVKLIVFDILGKEIATLVNEQKAAGTYQVEFNATELPSGIYFYKIITENFSAGKKMILLK